MINANVSLDIEALIVNKRLALMIAMNHMDTAMALMGNATAEVAMVA